jgi:hypothetical protein
VALKKTTRATDWREIDRWEGGVGWLAHPDEAMQRASHAVAVDDEVWLVDPIDVPDLGDLLAEFGTVAGVVLLLDRHKRDAARLANRHGVAVHVPATMAGIDADLDAPVEPVAGSLTDTGYAVQELIDNRFWREAVLYSEETGQLIVPEALGTASFYRAPGERLGVSPPLRLWPPRRLDALSPDRIDVGHGTGIDDDAAGALADALDGARRRAPTLYARTIRDFLLH